jgi:hypothetical protein
MQNYDIRLLISDIPPQTFHISLQTCHIGVQTCHISVQISHIWPKKPKSRHLTIPAGLLLTNN